MWRALCRRWTTKWWMSRLNKHRYCSPHPSASQPPSPLGKAFIILHFAFPLLPLVGDGGSIGVLKSPCGFWGSRGKPPPYGDTFMPPSVERGGHVIIRSATPRKKIKQLNKEFVFLRERRSLERKNTNFGQKDRLHAIQGVKCSYHTNILNGG